MGFIGERRLRHAVAAHGARCRDIGEDGIGVALEVRAGIVLVEGTERFRHDGMAVRGVGTLIRETLHLARGDRTVFAQPRDHVDADGVADAVGDEGLFAGAVELDGAAVDLLAAPGTQRLVQAILLVAEAAADVRLDDADVRPRAAQRLPDDAADDVRDLRGAGQDEAAVFAVAEAAVVFNVTVLHGGRIVPALDANQARLLNSLLIVARGGRGVLQNVVRIILVELRRAVLHRFLHVQHERQLLIFHLNGPHGLHRRDLVLRDDRADIIAVIAHVPVQQVPVGHVLMPRIHRPRVARRGERTVRHIKARQDLHHAGDLLCRRRVHGFDEAVRDRRVLHPDDQRVARGQIVVVFCPPGRLVKGVDADLTLPRDCHRCSTSIRFIDAGKRSGCAFSPFDLFPLYHKRRGTQREIVILIAK